jgi:hypothetical protein
MNVAAVKLRSLLQHFSSKLIFDFSWSHDGKQMLLSRGDRTSDVVMISGFQ